MSEPTAPPGPPGPEAPEPRPPSPTVGERVAAAPITFAIIAIDIAWFVWAEKHGSTNDTPILIRFGAVEPVHVWSGEVWRLASYMFLHIGWVHLLWNCWAGAGICAAVEKALGRTRFLVAYLLSGIAGGCASTVLLYAPSAGASGAMFGMIGALLAIRRRQLHSFRAFLSDSGTRSTLVQIGLWTLIGLTAMPFNNRAHLGGLASGAAVTWVLTSNARSRRLFGPLLAFASAALVVLACRPWWHPSGDELVRLRGFGAAYLDGANGYPKDRPRGERMANKACAAGSGAACVDLGTVLQYDDEAGQRQGAVFLERACGDGNDIGCGELGAAYSTGRGVPRDEARALELYRRGCNAESPSACVGLATMMFQGRVMTRDAPGALEIFHRWCAKGEQDACAGEGFILVYGAEGVAQDEARGRELLREACTKESAWSCALEKTVEQSPPSADGGPPD